MSKSKEIKQTMTDKILPETELNRRDVLKKYGAYTAPLVVSILLPERAYAMFGSTPFSSTAACQAAHSGMQATNMHCDPGRMHVS